MAVLISSIMSTTGLPKYAASGGAHWLFTGKYRLWSRVKRMFGVLAMFHPCPYSRDTYSRKTAMAARLRHVSLIPLKSSDRVREEEPSRRSETRPVLQGLASPRIARSTD